MVIFHQRLSCIKGHLQSMVIFTQSLVSIKSHLPTNINFYQRLSSIKVFLPSGAGLSVLALGGQGSYGGIGTWFATESGEVVFHQRWYSSLKGPLPSLVAFQERLTSIKSHPLMDAVYFKCHKPWSILNCYSLQVLTKAMLIAECGVWISSDSFSYVKLNVFIKRNDT